MRNGGTAHQPRRVGQVGAAPPPLSAVASNGSDSSGPAGATTRAFTPSIASATLPSIDLIQRLAHRRYRRSGRPFDGQLDACAYAAHQLCDLLEAGIDLRHRRRCRRAAGTPSRPSSPSVMAANASFGCSAANTSSAGTTSCTSWPIIGRRRLKRRSRHPPARSCASLICLSSSAPLAAFGPGWHPGVAPRRVRRAGDRDRTGWQTRPADADRLGNLGIARVQEDGRWTVRSAGW